MATFNFTFDPGTTIQQMIGFEIAGNIWGKYLTDNVTINLQVGVTSGLGSNVIGGALPGMRASQSYQSYRTALNSGPKSADDNTALSSLPNAANYTTAFLYYQNNQAVWQTESQSTLNMTRAVAKSAGMSLTDGNTALDGYILFSNLANATANGQAVRWSYDYTRSSTQTTNTLDFLSTAIHEIGHVLGFVSGVDQPGLLGMRTDLSRTTGSSTQAYKDGMRDRLQYTNPLDLFRYSGSGRRDMSYGKTWDDTGGTGDDAGVTGYESQYFSLDSGKSVITKFASGIDTSNYGDGYQSSHWSNSINAIMNPTLSLKQRRNIAAIDLQAMDVMGWDIASTGINTTIDLSALQTQSRQTLATRSGQSTTWIANNLAASPTNLVANRDQQIYTMLQNSVVYDLTRIAAPGATGWTTRLSLEQVFQQRSLFSTVDELDSSSDMGFSLPLPEIAISSDLVSDRHFTNPAASAPQLLNTAGAIAPLAKFLHFYQKNLSPSASPSPMPLQKITIEVSAQTVIASQKSAERLGSDRSFRSRAYDTRASRNEFRNPRSTANQRNSSKVGEHSTPLDNLQFLDAIAF